MLLRIHRKDASKMKLCQCWPVPGVKKVHRERRKMKGEYVIMLFPKSQLWMMQF